jgi:hypothetical protein
MSKPRRSFCLECVPAAPAHYLVTGNTKLFPTLWTNIRMVTARWLPDSVLADKSCRVFKPGPPERSRRGPSIDPRHGSIAPV